MTKATITYTRTLLGYPEVQTIEIEESEMSNIYPRITGALQGLVGFGNPTENAIIGIEIV